MGHAAAPVRFGHYSMFIDHGHWILVADEAHGALRVGKVSQLFSLPGLKQEMIDNNLMLRHIIDIFTST